MLKARPTSGLQLTTQQLLLIHLLRSHSRFLLLLLARAMARRHFGALTPLSLLMLMPSLLPLIRTTRLPKLATLLRPIMQLERVRYLSLARSAMTLSTPLPFRRAPRTTRTRTGMAAGDPRMSSGLSVSRNSGRWTMTSGRLSGPASTALLPDSTPLRGTWSSWSDVLLLRDFHFCWVLLLSLAHSHLFRFFSFLADGVMDSVLQENKVMHRTWRHLVDDGLLLLGLLLKF